MRVDLEKWAQSAVQRQRRGRLGTPSPSCLTPPAFHNVQETPCSLRIDLLPPPPGSEGELVLLNRPLAYSASAQMSSPSSLLPQRTDGLGLSPRSVSIRAASLFTPLAGARRTSEPCQTFPEGLCGALFSAMLSLSVWLIQLARVDLQHQGETLSKMCLTLFAWQISRGGQVSLLVERGLGD